MSTIKTNAITTVAGKPILNSTGSILQVVSNNTSTTFTSTSTSYADAFSVTITPTSASSKIYIECNALVCADSWNGGPHYYALRRGSTLLTSARYNNWAGSQGDTLGNTLCSALTYLDSPATTASITYNFSVATPSTSYTVSVNRSVNGTTVPGSSSTITVFEISG